MLLPDARSSYLLEPRRAIEGLCRGLSNSLKVLRVCLEGCACAAGLLLYLAVILGIVVIAACWQVLFGQRMETDARTQLNPGSSARRSKLSTDDGFANEPEL
jgi:hypothetical protein